MATFGPGPGTPGGRAGGRREGPADAARPFTIVHVLQPRFRDTDAMGHINNAVYVTYLEVARQEYWTRFTGTRDYGRVPFILAHVTIDFRSEALVSETLEIGIRCDWIRTRSFAFVYEIRAQATQRLVVEASTILVCYDYAAKASIPMPAELRQALEAFEGRSLGRTAPV
jgi:acyl-CoA thioester hydrolase